MKKTKKSLLLSALALVLCASMFVGTTFAWFTDSVTSANNVITSGNLDIELEYWDGDSWEDVEGKSDILTNTLWEPGVTEVAYLRMANAGTLALKYLLGINIVSETAGVNAAGDDFLLSDYIQFGVVAGVNGETGKYATREDAVSAVTSAQKISAGYTDASTLAPTAEIYLALVVYMPTDVGNEANHNGEDIPEINLGINVFATQATVEVDSFDKNYDAGAPWLGGIDTAWYTGEATEYVINTADELAGLAKLVNEGNSLAGKTIKLGGDIDLNNLAWTPIGTDLPRCFSGTFDGDGHTIYNLNVESVNNAGLFGYSANGGDIMNLTVKNATVKGNDYAGVIMGRGYMIIDNCRVENATVIVTPYLQNGIYDGGAKAGGIIGQILEGAGNGVTNCSVNNVKISGFRDIGGVVGMVHNNNSCSDNTASNVTLSYVLCDQITADRNENAGAIYGRVQASATVSPAKDSAENQAFAWGPSVSIVTNAAELKSAINAAQNGATITLAADITLSSDIAISNANFTLDGNGYTITGTGTYGLFDITGGTVALKNVTFDGVTGPIIRTVDATLDATNVTVMNGTSTKQQGLFRLVGKSTITNCTFKNNTCSMVITLNYDADSNTPQVVENCVFEGNTCKDTAVVYYVTGAGATIKANKFVDNSIDSNGHAAVLYCEETTVTGNEFTNNTVNAAGKRVGVIVLDAGVVSDNVFVGNEIATTASGPYMATIVSKGDVGTELVLSNNGTADYANVKGNTITVE